MATTTRTTKNAATTTTTTTTTHRTRRTEEVYVLFGSQTGNGEQAAKDMCERSKIEFNSEQIKRFLLSAQKYNNNNNTNNKKNDTTDTDVDIDVIFKCMQLDDFLEIEHAKFTRLIIIFVSSYGHGQAPLGGYLFRDLCDEWIRKYDNNDNDNNNDKKENKNSKDDNDNDKKSSSITTTTTSTSSSSSSRKLPLTGIHYAICGLGDSKFSTFFNNPTIIDKALRCAGAIRVGPFGCADASGVGRGGRSTKNRSDNNNNNNNNNDPQEEDDDDDDDDQRQEIVIERWITNIWQHLAPIVAVVDEDDDDDDKESTTTIKQRLLEIQKDTLSTCRDINPSVFGNNNNNHSDNKAAATTMTANAWIDLIFLVSMTMAILSVIAYKWLN